MSQPPRRSVLFAVLIAAVITLAVSLLRLYGELHGWPPLWCAKSPKEGLGLLGITWLVPVFGFWFGRRLAASGNRPAHAGKAVLWCLLGLMLTAGIGWVAMTQAPPSMMPWLFGIGMPLAGLTAFKGWRSAWFATAGYGVLARIPVLVIQHEAIARGWNTHYAKGPRPDMTPAQIEAALTLVEATFWPFAFTAIIGTMFAVLGAVTTKRSG